MNQAVATASAEAEAPVFKYVLELGRHNVVESDGSRKEYRAGDEIMLTEAAAARFINKFRRVTVPTEDTTPIVQAPPTVEAPPAAPTVKELEAALASLPATIDDAELVYDDAKEAKEDFSRVFGELLHDGYSEQIQNAFVPPVPAPAPTPTTTKSSKGK